MTDEKKEIEKIAKCFCDFYGGHMGVDVCGGCIGEKSGFLGCHGGLDVLVSAGYRDVKETAKRIIEDICGMIDGIPTTDTNELNHLELLKIAIIKKYKDILGV